jgi:multidrug efflux pump
MLALGFSLNNLTLFGLVLAIGIVVDDAIVVVEAVEHHIEHGLAPREATIKAMEQVSGPVIAVGLVLSAVFVPCAFISGITGHFFRQFALTISVSTIISAFNSLTLSPALTALLLKPHDKVTAPPLPRLSFALAGGWLCWLFGTAWLRGWLDYGAEHLPASISSSLEPFVAWIAAKAMVVFGAAGGWLVGGVFNRMLGWFFRTFNAGFGLAARAYTHAVGWSLRISLLMLAVYGGLVWLTVDRLRETPKGFIPSQDMGYLLVAVQLPDSASSERTDAVLREIQDRTRRTPGIRHATTIRGQSFVLNANGSNFGTMFINLEDYDKRQTPGLSAESLANRLFMEFGAEIPEAQVLVFPPPPVRGVGRAGGFMFMVEDRGDFGPQELQKVTDNLVLRAAQTPGLVRTSTSFRANVPQLHVDADPRECLAKGVRLTDFADTLAIYQGSLYVNDFNLFGHTWQVIVQSDAQFRDEPEDLARLKVRNRNGGMVPLGSLASVREITGPLVLTRYNMYPAASINGSAAPGTSSFDAIDLMKKLAKEEFPRGISYEWTDMSYLEVRSGNDATKIFGFAVLMVFLVLAFQYENWSLPLAVILVVPMCLLSAIIGVNLAGMDINIFTNIGFVVLVGLASKNAILIVEFAKVQRAAGMPRRQAALEACNLRFRPIIMTSLAFVLGVLPLMISHGAGFEMRRTLGTAVFSGMLGVTLFGIFLTPVFFYTIDSLGESRLFASRFMRTINSVSIEALRVVRPKRVLALVRGRSRAVPRVEGPVDSALELTVKNGAATPNGNINSPPAHLRESVKQK